MENQRVQKISVSGVLIREGKMLMVKKDDESGYTLPTTNIEFGEQPQEALMRGYLDITALVVEPFVALRTWSEISLSGDEHTVTIVYLVELVDENENFEPLVDEPYSEFAWVHSENIGEYVNEDDEETSISVQMAFELYQDWAKQMN